MFCLLSVSVLPDVFVMVLIRNICSKSNLPTLVLVFCLVSSDCCTFK